METSNDGYIPVLIQLIVAGGFVAGTLWITHILGPNRKSAKKLETFECGIEPQGNARLPFSIKYFLTAILFVLFDVEVIFFYPWATNFREFGTQGFVSMGIFVSLFLLGFLYLRKKQAFKWE
ncbi:MAG: NADH-quinone oxidoreductase subunit A [Bacteroidia bacterium]|jgi:NADH-quinone oxidoreductase subunit A|nr:NADH-quinone oxidoreductase subunit A [Bacteroidia bacterium]